jgi:hypothetical protein
VAGGGAGSRGEIIRGSALPQQRSFTQRAARVTGVRRGRTMARMKPMRLVVAAALAVLSFDVGHALFTHNSVGALEWVVGAAVVVLLALIAASYGRRSLRRT